MVTVMAGSKLDLRVEGNRNWRRDREDAMVESMDLRRRMERGFETMLGLDLYGERLCRFARG